MNYKKSALVLAFGLLNAVSASAADSLTYRGVTFNTLAVNSNTLSFSILNATQGTGDWADIEFLKAFEIKNIGDVASATISGPGSFAPNVDNGLSANVGCATGNTNGACFSMLSPLALTDSMTWTIGFTATGSSLLDLSTPHLKVQFLNFSGDKKAVGGVLSQDLLPVAVVPEPESYAMMLVGLGLIGSVVARRRNQRPAA